MSTSSHMVVVAIDFGTTFSGYAFSFKSDPKVIITNTSWSKHLISMKAPTSILLDPDRKFHSFGYEAENKYGELLEDDRDDGWSLFRKFKMILYNNSEVSDKTFISDFAKATISDVANATTAPALQIFSLAIQYLKDHALSTLNTHSKITIFEVKDSDIFFVITVPAIWDDKAKRLMREAAMEAGIAGDHLGIVLEPEAASIWCQTIPLITSSGEGKIINTPGTRYMVVDLGGGTADITIHETLRGGKLRELHKASGGDWGGTQVDKHFISMLTQLMGKETMKQFGEECLSDFFDLLREFEITKRTISASTTRNISIKLPASLHEISRKNRKGQNTRAEFLKTLKASVYGQRVSIKGDKMRVDSDLARDMFQYSVNGLCKHMHTLFTSPNLRNVDIVLFVGGFSECSLIQSSMKEQFLNKRLIFPPEGSLSVLKGAVLYGHTPGIIAIRKARFTYGIRVIEDFKKDVH